MRKITKWIFTSTIIIVVLLIYMLNIVNPVVYKYAQAELDAVAVKAVNNGVMDVVNANTYSNLTDIRRDEDGVIVSISADVIQMNRVAGEVTIQAEKHLETMGSRGIPIPIGTFSGIPLLVGRGFPLLLKADLIGAVNCRFDSKFISAGINQTQHKIILQVDAVVDLILPLFTKRTNITVEMLFADSIIVGKVPEFMFTK